VFQFVAPVSGRIVVRQDATSGSGLDSIVRVFDGAQQFLGEDDDSGEGSNSLLVLQVTAGQTYYIQAAAFGTSTGGYLLSLAPAPADVGDDFAHAAPLLLAADGSGTQAGSIDAAGDIDVFQFVAPVTGRLDVRQDADPGSELLSVVSAFDDAGQILGDGESSGDGSESRLGIDVVAGRTYYLGM
jgi:hypothetical protein